MNARIHTNRARCANPSGSKKRRSQRDFEVLTSGLSRWLAARSRVRAKENDLRRFDGATPRGAGLEIAEDGTETPVLPAIHPWEKTAERGLAIGSGRSRTKWAGRCD